MINDLGLYGTPAMLNLHGSLRIKYITEFLAALHIYNANDPRFLAAPSGTRRKVVPPSMRPDVAWCTGCRDWHNVGFFDKDSSRPNGLQHYCRDQRAARRKVSAAKKEVSWSWTRTAK